MRRRSWLAGISDAHVRSLEAFQPYNGCQWAAHLATLSNTDKHNDLVTLKQGIQFQIIEGVAPDERHQMVISTYGLHLELSGLPVLVTLEHIGQQVTRVLQQFKSDFEK